MNKKEKITKQTILVRSLIVCLYLAIIAAFLYVPRIYRIFFPEKRVITLYSTRETFAVAVIRKFEKKAGVTVKLAYFNTNEELLAKFKISRGVGYDLVLSSDYMIEHLIDAGLLQPLDHKKISHIGELDRRMLGQHYDPKNKYSLPLSWIPYGIGYNKKFLSLDNNVSWEVVFKKEALRKLGNYKISMLNDAREAIFLTALYLFGTVKNFTLEKLEQITKTLIEQKEIVECYVEAGAKQLLLSKIVPMAVIPAARMKEMDDIENFGFVIPKEGSLVDIINFVIPATSQNADLAHQLIDFLLSKEVGAYNFEEVACNPANVNSYPLINKEYTKLKAFFPDDKLFGRLHVLNNLISPKLLEKIWFLVKAA